MERLPRMTEFLRDQASDSEEVPRKDKEIESRMLQGNFYTNKKKRNRKSGKEDDNSSLVRKNNDERILA